MNAEEIMIKNVYKVRENALVRDVIKNFIYRRISGLPIVDNKNKIVAYISDGDIMRYIGNHENIVLDIVCFTTIIQGDYNTFEERLKDILNLKVLDIAQKKVISVCKNTDIADIAAILAKKKIKKLPVEDNGTLIGIISRGDVIRHAFQHII